MRKIDIWDDADKLAMAVRLHEQRRATEEIENMLGSVIVAIVLMATKLLVKQDPSFIRYSELAFSKDTQAELVLLIFRKIHDGKVSTEKPRAMVNLFIKTAQNRLKNIRRNTTNRRIKGAQISETELKQSIDMLLNDEVNDLTGNKVTRISNNKVTNTNKE